MLEHFLLADTHPAGYSKPVKTLYPEKNIATSNLAAAITRQASKQTYYTIRFLVDRPLAADAYRAYAYFRWVDDQLDQENLARPERAAFVERQRTIIDRTYRGERFGNLTAEEQLVVDLIQNDRGQNDGLRAYIDNMMAVMVFDAERRGRTITQKELVEYTRWLATAVTEALHHFIGHNCAAPQDETRYLAVTAAHITHMLRDTIEDIDGGYYNIPQEFLAAHGIEASDVNSDVYRLWVQSQVQLARSYFQIGRDYLARVQNPRCRIAGYAYIARFEVVLDAIEKDDYRLRADYPERKNGRAALKMGWSALSQVFRAPGGNHMPFVAEPSL
ncbi:MAG: squalene/phytoene synthase family protein [Ardenticatenaceae bacterium]|nr:squalene/phytoene synthase family protein [Ardenticatenaceae bacterium]